MAITVTGFGDSLPQGELGGQARAVSADLSQLEKGLNSISKGAESLVGAALARQANDIAAYNKKVAGLRQVAGLEEDAYNRKIQAQNQAERDRKEQIREEKALVRERKAELREEIAARREEASVFSSSVKGRIENLILRLGYSEATKAQVNKVLDDARATAGELGVDFPEDEISNFTLSKLDSAEKEKGEDEARQASIDDSLISAGIDPNSPSPQTDRGVGAYIKNAADRAAQANKITKEANNTTYLIGISTLPSEIKAMRTELSSQGLSDSDIATKLNEYADAKAKEYIDGTSDPVVKAEVAKSLAKVKADIVVDDAEIRSKKSVALAAESHDAFSKDLMLSVRSDPRELPAALGRLSASLSGLAPSLNPEEVLALFREEKKGLFQSAASGIAAREDLTPDQRMEAVLTLVNDPAYADQMSESDRRSIILNTRSDIGASQRESENKRTEASSKIYGEAYYKIVNSTTSKDISAVLDDIRHHAEAGSLNPTQAAKMIALGLNQQKTLINSQKEKDFIITPILNGTERFNPVDPKAVKAMNSYFNTTFKDARSDEARQFMAKTGFIPKTVIDSYEARVFNGGTSKEIGDIVRAVNGIVGERKGALNLFSEKFQDFYLSVSDQIMDSTDADLVIQNYFDNQKKDPVRDQAIRRNVDIMFGTGDEDGMYRFDPATYKSWLGDEPSRWFGLKDKFPKGMLEYHRKAALDGLRRGLSPASALKDADKKTAAIWRPSGVVEHSLSLDDQSYVERPPEQMYGVTGLSQDDNAEWMGEQLKALVMSSSQFKAQNAKSPLQGETSFTGQRVLENIELKFISQEKGYKVIIPSASGEDTYLSDSTGNHLYFRPNPNATPKTNAVYKKLKTALDSDRLEQQAEIDYERKYKGKIGTLPIDKYLKDSKIPPADMERIRKSVFTLVASEPMTVYTEEGASIYGPPNLAFNPEKSGSDIVKNKAAEVVESLIAIYRSRDALSNSKLKGSDNVMPNEMPDTPFGTPDSITQAPGIEDALPPVVSSKLGM